MGSNVTYLLGAGSSANQIPNVSDTWRKIGDLLAEMDEKGLSRYNAYQDLHWFKTFQGKYTRDAIAAQFLKERKFEEYQRKKKRL